MTEVNRIHIIKRGNKWALRKQGAKRAIKIYDIKEEAVKDAMAYRMSGFHVVVHKKDGSVERWVKPAASFKKVKAAPLSKKNKQVA